MTTSHATAMQGRLHLYTPAGVVASPPALQRAARRLRGMGFDVTIDEAAKARSQRFGGDDDTRLAALHRVARAAPSVAMASRGGYGTTRLLDRIDWKRLGRSVAQGTRWVGHSDLTALHLGLLAHGGAPSWAGPLAIEDFGRPEPVPADGAAAAGSGAGAAAEAGRASANGRPPAEAVDDVTRDAFVEAMDGRLEAVGFRTDAGFDGLSVRGVLWGGNLTVLCALLGTPHWPRVRGGVLFVEDVNEHPYRVERQLLQLHQAGVLGEQRAVLLGHFTGWRPTPLDRGYGLRTVLAALRARTRTPLLPGLPFGHVVTKVTLPVGRRVDLAVQGRQAFVGWG